MIIDTDVLIWAQRGSKKAASLIDRAEHRCISAQTYMEMLQGARNSHQMRVTKDFLRDFDFQIFPLTENIGHRASIYIESYALSHGMRVGDAIIAATACEAHLPLVSANAKHYRHIAELDLVVLKV